MQRTIIAVADATRARVFTFDRSDEAGEMRESLSERSDLVNPARRRTPAQLFSDTRTNTSRMGGKFFGVDDHRDAHIDELARDYVKMTPPQIRELLADRGLLPVPLRRPGLAPPS